MANIADNKIQIFFLNEPTIEEKTKAIQEFEQNVYELWSDWEQINEDIDEYDTVELYFGSKWTAPVEYMTEFCKKYNCQILGVSNEWANNYVESFELKP